MVTRLGFFGREGIFPPLRSLRRADFRPPLGFPFAGDLADIRGDLLAELVVVGEGDRGLAGVGEVEASCDEMQGDRHRLVAAGELLGEETGEAAAESAGAGQPAESVGASERRAVVEPDQQSPLPGIGHPGEAGLGNARCLEIVIDATAVLETRGLDRGAQHGQPMIRADDPECRGLGRAAFVAHRHVKQGDPSEVGLAIGSEQRVETSGAQQAETAQHGLALGGGGEAAELADEVAHEAHGLPGGAILVDGGADQLREALLGEPLDGQRVTRAPPAPCGIARPEYLRLVVADPDRQIQVRIEAGGEW